MQDSLPVRLHDGAQSTTAEVWAVLVAARDGDVGCVAEMVERLPPLATSRYNYTPPIHFAVREGHDDLVRFLVEHGALDPIDYGWDEVERLFESAVHGNRPAEVRRILEQRPALAKNPNASWGEGILMMPSGRRKKEMLDLLIGYGARVPDASKWGRFYYFKHYEIAEYLLENGMSPKHMSWHEVTLLHDLAQEGDLDKARLLLDHGAEIDALDEEYRSTPLGLAARWGQRKLASFLVERGADPNLAGAEWATPLSWSRKKGFVRSSRIWCQPARSRDET